MSFPIVDTDYDIVAKDPVNGEWATFQVKSLRKRDDRNSWVIPGKKSNGKAYSPDTVDYMLGIDTDTNTAYVTECIGLTEYWSAEMRVEKRWIKLSIEKEAKVG